MGKRGYNLPSVEPIYATATEYIKQAAPMLYN